MAINYTYDKKSLLKDGKRWFPIMGEIHYSRYPAEYWEEELLKMKAGGVDIVSSYVIWIHHEEVQGEWLWEGERNLRHFVELIGKCSLTMILRVGPWIHGEVRNGGFPDWLIKKCGGKERTNDETYFAEVKRYFTEIYSQVKGLFVKDGGPIIGIQVENEYGHCGGLSGAEGEEHIRRLTAMLKEIGFDVPLWTATGWGGAVTADLLPVMGGYCDAPWDPRAEEIEPSGNFVFTYERNDHAIGSDYGLGEGITFDMSKVPYLTAELGGGLQPTYRRRPVATAKDIVAMSLAKMGSGCTLLGYYMYHGGTNPSGKLTSMQEATSSGSLCDLLEKNYDFQAPLGEWGGANESYFMLRELFQFVHEHGEELCGMETFIPKDNPLVPTDFCSLRYSVRFNKETGWGYLFVNNYQRHNEMLDHYDAFIDIKEIVGLEDKNLDGTVCISVPNGDFAIYSVYIKDVIGTESIITGKKEFACKKVYPLNEKTVVINKRKIESRDLVYDSFVDGKHKMFIESYSVPSFIADKGFCTTPAGFKGQEMEGKLLYKYTATLPTPPAFSHSVLEAPKKDKMMVMNIHIDAWPNDHFGTLHDVFLYICYTGNCARLYKDGLLIADDLYMGQSHRWRIGLRRFGKAALDFRLEVDPLVKDASVYLESWPDFRGQDFVCRVEDIGVERLVRVEISL